MSFVRAVENKQKKDESITNYGLFIWEQYATAQLTNKAPDHTQLFFSAIPKPLKNHFDSSTKQILQLGMSGGKYIGELAARKKIKCIGYDYATSAIPIASKHGVNAKLIDLTAMNGPHLVYQDVLEEDLSVATDIVAIRVLEYLGPKAVELLIFALLNAANQAQVFTLKAV